MNNFSNIDLGLFFGYLFVMIGIGIWISQRKGGNQSTKDYFLASKSLPWWAVGGSLIASNISTEQILGMNGSGYMIGMAIASYELMAALTLIIVAKFFLPIFIKKGIYTMPQFLEERFDTRVRTLMAFFWVLLFIFVNITSILYLGGLAIQNIMGFPLWVGILGLVIYSASFSIFGGLKAVVWTDVIQVVVLILGGFLAAYWVLDAVGGGFFEGLKTLFNKAPEKFDMIFDQNIFYNTEGAEMGTMLQHTGGETDQLKSAYRLLPGIGVLIGGMWIANVYYWGNNQYIIQRALAAKSIKEAQRGVAFAAFIKLLLPIIVCVPGIAAFVILQDPQSFGFTGTGLTKPDEAFPWAINNFVGVGFKGIVFAALIAAIGSSISSLVNSTSTIFTLDIYKPLLNKASSDRHLVNVGKIVAGGALVIGACIAPALGSLDQVLQYIQEWTGFLSPGVVVVFIFGMFWKRATANAAFASIIIGFFVNMIFKFALPELPFLDRMAFTFLISTVSIIGISYFELKAKSTQAISDMPSRIGLIVALCLISVPVAFFIFLLGAGPLWLGIIILIFSLGVFVILLTERKVDDKKAISFEKSLFKTDNVFNVSAVLILVILSIIYISLW